jgi:DNA-binding FadR family transcriptional regulator
MRFPWMAEPSRNEVRMSAKDATIRIPKAAELVADTLRRRIITGEYAPNELLPPEGSVMSTFNVARTTVRDAFRILESEGLLVVRRGAGGGGRVQVPSIGMVANNAGVLLQIRGTTLEDVHRARIMIEAPVAAMLAERSDDHEMIQQLRDALDAEAAAMDDPTELTRAEGRFHQRLVQVAGSKTVEMLSAVANRIIAEQVAAMVSQSGAARSKRKHLTDAHKAHERLVSLIEAGKAVEAEALWRRHLEEGLTHLMNAADAKTVVDVMS